MIRSSRHHASKLYLLLVSVLVVICTACSIAGPSDTASIIAELDTKLPPVIASGNSPSIQVAVVHQGQIAWSKAFGDNTSVEHVYMNASVQKLFTATAVLQLVERGLIELDTDINRYIPFAVRHPSFPETPITAQMLLAHRSGLDEFPHQFAWDTGSAFSPQYRPPCPTNLQNMSLEEYLLASLTLEGSNYDQGSWIYAPDQEYHYSISTFPFLRYLISQVTGQSYEAYMQENIFAPLGMTRSGFSADAFSDRHAVPYTRIDGENIELPIWNGQGSLMHTTANDMAKFMLTIMNDGRYGDFELLQPESIDLMQQRTTRFEVNSNSDDLPLEGHGLGLFIFTGGWFGQGGSAPGFQSLLRFHPSRQVGYVINANVNAILGGGMNYESARSDIYTVQNILVSILDPTFVIRRQAKKILLIGGTVLCALSMGFWILRRMARQRDVRVP